MRRDLLVIFLLAVILSLVIPVTTQNLYTEPAFTSDNLIIIEKNSS